MSNKYLRCIWRAAFACILFACGISVASAENPERNLTVHWVNLQPDDGLIVDAVVLFFHDGSFDLYDTGSAPSSLLTRLAKHQFDGLESLIPGVKIAVMTAPHEPSPFGGTWGELSSAVTASLNPTQHRYATAYIALRPSNDAFLGNEDGYRIRLFDLGGNPELPVVVEFGGSEVMDAGICANNEASLQFLDVTDMTAQPCQAENGVVRRHAGFNGSVRNPDATPVRILGGTSVDMGGITGVRHYDRANADFSRGGTQIGRLVFMQTGSAGSLTGSFYNPARSGEGFNIEVFHRPGSDAALTVVYFYTYEPGTGRPLWLIGSGELGQDIVMASAHGGSINSPSNPDTVVVSRWGTLRLPAVSTVDWCMDGVTITYAPDDPSIPGGQYPVQRLTPRGDALEALCRQLYPPTRIY